MKREIVDVATWLYADEMAQAANIFNLDHRNYASAMRTNLSFLIVTALREKMRELARSWDSGEAVGLS